MFEEVAPDGWEQFVQPGGLTPEAENVDNLPPGYYERISQGKDAAWIDVYVNGNYGFIVDGRPVYPQWQDKVHATRVDNDPDAELIIGIDFGLTPAAVFVQVVDGQFQVVDELVTEEFSAVEFADALGALIRSGYRGRNVSIYGDPAGEQRSQVDKRTPFMVLKAAGIHAVPARTGGKHDNDVTLRVEAVVRNLTRLTMAGDPGLIIDPGCRYLRRAMAGGYKFRLMQISGEERFHEHPEKNIYSHCAEALQYALVGAGQAREVVGSRRGAAKPLDYSRVDRGLM